MFLIGDFVLWVLAREQCIYTESYFVYMMFYMQDI